MEVSGAESMQAEAARFASSLAPQHVAVVIALSGALGAGKTTFTQALAKALGVKEQVTSPTFVIRKRYPLEGVQFRALIHIDAYRLKGEHELEVLGFAADIADPLNIVVIEWPERISRSIPTTAKKVSFGIGDGTKRTITYGS